MQENVSYLLFIIKVKINIERLKDGDKMNETIGVKGGKRDQKRRLIITKNQKKRLEEYQKELDKYELEKLEKRVKQLQRATLVKTLPIVVTGQIIEAFSPYKEKNEEIKDFIPISSEEKTTSKDNIKVISTKKEILKDKGIIRETLKGNTKATQKEPSKEDKYVTLSEYVSRMKEEDKDIYYASGESIEKIKTTGRNVI